LIIAAVSVLVVSGVIIGLVFGLRKRKNKPDIYQLHMCFILHVIDI
jgi:hypothetical protein